VCLFVGLYGSVCLSVCLSVHCILVIYPFEYLCFKNMNSNQDSHTQMSVTGTALYRIPAPFHCRPELVWRPTCPSPDTLLPDATLTIMITPRVGRDGGGERGKEVYRVKT